MTITNPRRGAVVSILCVLCFFCVLCGESIAQPQGMAMPDPKMMSGIPRPVDDLPMGSISVRLIRGSLSNNITKYPVELHIGTKVVTVNTDENGRAQFDHLLPASTVQAVAVVDGERLESQEFTVPDRGGIRLMLVATDKEKEAREAAAAAAPAVTGNVSFNDQSRILVEPGDETLDVYYLLTVTNPASTPVKTPAPFFFDMPTGATGTTVLEGSSSQARADGARIYFDGAFPPGDTSIQVACSLPVYSDTVNITQKFPAMLPQVGVIARKIGALKLSSPQIARQQEMPTNGETAVVAELNTVQAGQPFELTLSGLPHHSAAPRYAALGLALAVLLVGVWAASSTGKDRKTGVERQQLIGRREKLFNDLLRLENDRRNNRVDRTRYAARRDELLAALERIYAALDTEEAAA